MATKKTSPKSPGKVPALKGVGFWREQWLPAMLLLVIPFALYFPTSGYGYVLDDKMVLSENVFVQRGSKGLPEIFGMESMEGYLKGQQALLVGGRYRPLSIATFAMEHQLWGPGKAGRSHMINVLLYGLTALVLFRLLALVFRQSDRPWYLSIAFLGSLLFVLHPIHTEVVANIKGRDEILALLFSLLAMLQFMRYLAGGGELRLLWSGMLFFPALLAKENALTFVAVAPLAAVLLGKHGWKKAALATLPMLIATVAFVALRAAVMGFVLDNGKEVTDLMNNPFVGMTGGERYATITYTMGWYIKLLFVPHPLTHDYYPYHVPIVGWGSWQALVSMGVVLGLLALAAWCWRRAAVVSFGVLYFFLTMSMVSNLVFPVGTFMNERFLYMPSVGWCLLLAWLLSDRLPQWMPEGRARGVALSFMALVGVAFALRTVTRVPDWATPASLEEASIGVSVNSARSNQYYAYTRYEMAIKEQDPVKQKALLDEAWPYVNRAIEIYPKYGDAHTCRAGIAASYYQRDGDIDKLLGVFENTIRTKPVSFVDEYLDYLVAVGAHKEKLAMFFHRIGFVYFFQEKHMKGDAQFYLDKGLRLAPDNAMLRADRATVG